MPSTNLGRVQGASLWRASLKSVNSSDSYLGTIVPETGVTIKPLVGDLAMITKSTMADSNEYIGEVCSITGVSSSIMSQFIVSLKPLFKLTGEQGLQGPQGEPGPQGPKGDKGEGLEIKKYYQSADAMNSDYSNPDIAIGDTVAVSENGIITLYVKGASTFEYVGVLSANYEEYVDVDIDCDHEYEITGETGHEYGVAIEDSQMLLKKIQGQTRRYSLNLFGYKFSETNAGITFSTDENGIITLNGTSTGSTLYRDSITIPAGEYTFAFVGNTNSEFKFTINQVGSFNSNIVQSWNYPNSTMFGFSINIPSGVVLNNLKLYPMLVLGTYTQDTMPAFQPYDDTLVNSKCNLISTGRNLLDISSLAKIRTELGFNTELINPYTMYTSSTDDSRTWSFQNSDIKLTLPAGTYTILGQYEQLLPNQLLHILDAQDNVLTSLIGTADYGTTDIQTQTFTLNSQQTIGIMCKLFRSSISLALYYGTGKTDFEPYIEDSYPVGIELAAYDYIDNVSHLLVRQTSNVITLDGSSDENWQIIPESPSKRFQITNLLSDTASPNSTSTIIVSSNWINTSADNTFLNKNGVSVAGNDLHIYNENYVDDLDGFKAWLKSNPIQIVYKLATPTTEQLLLPAGYAVYTGGLQQQVIAEGKYLPYVLSKEYAISISSQVKVNIEIDRVQQAQINQNTSDISNIKKEFSDLSVMVESTEESLISGATGSEYGLALKDVENPLVPKIYGKTRRYSLNLLNLPDMAETTKNGVTCSVSNGVVKVKGTNTASSDITFTLAENMQFFGNDFSMDVGYDFTQLNNVNKFYVILSKISYESIMLFNFNNNTHGFATKNNLTEVSRLSVVIVSGREVDITLTPMLVSGIYTKDTMPAFQPYDDNLVNSKCNLISTGRNLIKLSTASGTSGLGAISYTSHSDGTIVLKSVKATYNGERVIIPLGITIPAGKYTLSLFNAKTINNPDCYVQFYYHDDTFTGSGGQYTGATYLNITNSTQVIDIQYPTSQLDIRFSNNVTINGTLLIKPMLVYGDTAPTEYEPYKQDTMQIDVELGKNDYIDNEANLIVRQQSEIITLDGSSDETWYLDGISSASPYKRYKIYLSNMGISNSADVVVNNLKYGKNLGNTAYDATEIGFNVEIEDNTKFKITFISDETSIDNWKTYLQSNPIQISYKLATPTTETINLAADYIVYPNGLQKQVVSEGKHLPYSKIVKKYAISSRSQILHVIEINKDQQAQINQSTGLINRLPSYAASYKTLRLEDWILKIENVAGNGTFNCSLEKIKQYIDNIEQNKMYQHTVLININNEIAGFVIITNRSATSMADINDVIEFLSSKGFISESASNYTFYPMQGKLSSGSSQNDLLGIFTFSGKDSVAVAYLDSSNAVKRSSTYFTSSSSIVVKDTVVTL